jgi:hypothetical protein
MSDPRTPFTLRLHPAAIKRLEERARAQGVDLRRFLQTFLEAWDPEANTTPTATPSALVTRDELEQVIGRAVPGEVTRQLFTVAWAVLVLLHPEYDEAECERQLRDLLREAPRL